MNYEEMVQEGLRQVVRQSLERAQHEELPGAHHFYISFQTNFPGVRVPESLLSRHPEEMTIVIQHQYWDLEVTDEGFGVTLSFNDSQERVYVPFEALLSFMDPSVKFGLQFTPPPLFDLDEDYEGDGESDEPLELKDNVVTLDTFRRK